jgi:type II secretory pathway predicted ATPase ExeA
MEPAESAGFRWSGPISAMLEHWQLTHNPFAAAEGEFFLTSASEEALSRLLFLVEQNRRCGVVLGPEQVGKSRLLREVSREVHRPNLFAMRVDATGLTSHEFAVAIAAALGSPRNRWDTVADAFCGFKAIHATAVWLIDQFEDAADDLTVDVLRLLRLMDRTGVAGTVLIAATRLRDPRWNGITDLCVPVDPWSVAECREFIEQRLEAAHASRRVFSGEGIAAVAECSRGLPGQLIRLSDLALQAGWTLGETVIDAELVRSLAGEFRPIHSAAHVTPTTEALIAS